LLSNIWFNLQLILEHQFQITKLKPYRHFTCVPTRSKSIWMYR